MTKNFMDPITCRHPLGFARPTIYGIEFTMYEFYLTQRMVIPSGDCTKCGFVSGILFIGAYDSLRVKFRHIPRHLTT